MTVAGSVRERETEPSALANRLRREERIEEATLDALGNPQQPQAGSAGRTWRALEQRLGAGTQSRRSVVVAPAVEHDACSLDPGAACWAATRFAISRSICWVWYSANASSSRDGREGFSQLGPWSAFGPSSRRPGAFPTSSGSTDMAPTTIAPGASRPSSAARATWRPGIARAMVAATAPIPKKLCRQASIRRELIPLTSVVPSTRPAPPAASALPDWT